MKTKTHNKTKILSIVLTSLILTLSTDIKAQQDSLLNYLRIAAEKNPEVLQKLSEYNASVQKVAQAGSLPDPEMTAGVFLSPMELINGKQVADIKLMQMFPWFGTLKASKDEMSSMAGAKYASVQAAKLGVCYDVRSTWYELIKTKERLRIAKENLGILNTVKQLALKRFSSGGIGGANQSVPPPPSSANTGSVAQTGSDGMQGMGGNKSAGATASGNNMQTMPGSSMNNTGTGLTDLYRIEMEINELENDISVLMNSEKSITARFNSYLDRNPATQVSCPDSLVMVSISSPLLEVADSTFKNSPMLQMLQYEGKSFEAREKMVTKMGYPMAGIGVDYSLTAKSGMSSSSMNGKDMIMPMVSLTLPIYRKKYRAMKNETGFMKEAVNENYRSTVNSLQTSYYEAVQSLRDSKRRVGLYNSQSRLASGSLSIMIKSFSAGEGTLADLLLVRRQLNDYELGRIEAVADYNTSVALIKQILAYE